MTIQGLSYLWNRKSCALGLKFHQVQMNPDLLIMFLLNHAILL